MHELTRHANDSVFQSSEKHSSLLIQNKSVTCLHTQSLRFYVSSTYRQLYSKKLQMLTTFSSSEMAAFALVCNRYLGYESEGRRRMDSIVRPLSLNFIN